MPTQSIKQGRHLVRKMTVNFFYLPYSENIRNGNGFLVKHLQR